MFAVGGCCAPNRYKASGFLYQDDGSTYAQTGNKIVAISDRPMSQNITVTGWYMKKFVDDHAMVRDTTIIFYNFSEFFYKNHLQFYFIIEPDNYSLYSSSRQEIHTV